MPQAPNVDGLPLWLQVAITLTFGITTLAIALRGYLPKPKSNPPSAMPEMAHLADMGAVRNLSEEVRTLQQCIVTLERSNHELIHWLRDKAEVEREICQRLRELREALDRRGLS